MKRGNIYRVALLGALGLNALACSVRGSATADAKFGGDERANAQVEGSIELNGSTARAIRYEDGRLVYQGNIEFEYNRADLSADGGTQNTLAELRDFLKEHPAVHLEIGGHTDSRGSEIHNKLLSQNRANSLKNWLVDHGIDEERLSAVGFGESQPQVAEPEECRNKVPADQSPCEEAWRSNRRAVFATTAGEETIQEAEEPARVRAEPDAPPEPAAQEPVRKCRIRRGLHANLGGPRTVFGGGAEFAIEPLCWLELSLGLGLGAHYFEVERGGYEANATALNLTVPLRGRVWFMKTHSLLLDLGGFLSSYSIKGEDNISNGFFDYERTGRTFGGFAALGYGYRSDKPFRIAVMLGVHGQQGKLDNSAVDYNLPDGAAFALQDALDESTDELLDVGPYLEVSFGWLW